MSVDQWEIEEAIHLAKLLTPLYAIDGSAPRADLICMGRDVFDRFGDAARRAFRDTMAAAVLARLSPLAVSADDEAAALLHSWFQAGRAIGPRPARAAAVARGLIPPAEPPPG